MNTDLITLAPQAFQTNGEGLQDAVSSIAFVVLSRAVGSTLRFLEPGGVIAVLIVSVIAVVLLRDRRRARR